MKYLRHIEKMTKLWPDCWGLLYIADDKFRLEHIDRVRRRIEWDIARGIAAPPLWNAAARGQLASWRALTKASIFRTNASGTPPPPGW